MNPYAIIGTLGLMLALCAVSFEGGHRTGVNAQKVADQQEFDHINADIAKQKSDANTLYRAAQDKNVVLAVERDAFKTKLEKQYVLDKKNIDDLRARYAGERLLYEPSQSAGRGNGGTGTTSGAGSSSPAGSTFLQIPDAITADLRSLTYDADELAANYKKCREYAIDGK
jgi:hypothetical protein